MCFCTPNKNFSAELLSDRGAVSGKNVMTLINAREINVFLSTSAYSWFHFPQLLVSQRISEEFHFYSTHGEAS